MKTIHKIAAVVIKDNQFFMVRKVGKEVWTSLGGKPEAGETEEQALLREIQEEVHCDATIVKKLGDFEAKAAHDDAIVRLSTYLVDLQGEIKLDDPELEESRFIGKDWQAEGIKLPPSIKDQILPYCIKAGLLDW
jgi:8-oxo-dGTP pyrophosphatase MutT (NUDIX family)